MKLKKILVLVVPLLCAAQLSAQSLYELAQKEKKRRTKYQGKQVRVVTNADLEKARRIPAVILGSAQAEPDRPSKTTPDPVSAPPRITVSQESSPQLGRPEGRVEGRRFATKVLTTSELVRNPEAALYAPDGESAAIEFYGFLDLEIETVNGAGEDIAVYVTKPTDGQAPENMHYLVFSKDRNGEWIGLGVGGGMASPERFDLGELRKASVIRIVYRNLRRMYDTHIDPRDITRGRYTINIDAVAALH